MGQGQGQQKHWVTVWDKGQRHRASSWDKGYGKRDKGHGSWDKSIRQQHVARTFLGQRQGHGARGKDIGHATRARTARALGNGMGQGYLGTALLGICYRHSLRLRQYI